MIQSVVHHYPSLEQVIRWISFSVGSLVVQRDPFDEVMGTIAVGLLAGMAAGTAMRSFLWMPLFFC